VNKYLPGNWFAYVPINVKQTGLFLGSKPKKDITSPVDVPPKTPLLPDKIISSPGIPLEEPDRGRFRIEMSTHHRM
jgi:hypothetical protein